MEGHGFDTEAGDGESGLNTEGGGGRVVSIRWAVVERSWERSYLFCFICSSWKQL